MHELRCYEEILSRRMIRIIGLVDYACKYFKIANAFIRSLTMSKEKREKIQRDDKEKEEEEEREEREDLNERMK